jgi:hypothetical protein
VVPAPRFFFFLLLLLVPALCLATASPAQAQPWAGILEPSRAIDWSRGHQGIAGGIPKRTTVCAALKPGVTAAQINAAIAACPDHQVVFLESGTYTVSGLTFGGKSHVTLRGAGPDRTVLKFSGPDPCGGFAADICVKGADILARTWPGHAPEDAGQVRSWVGGYAQGATHITVDSASRLSVGMTIALDQLDDDADTGGALVSHARDKVVENVSTGRVGRAHTQWVRITAINDNRLTITPGLYMPSWRASQRPQIWWAQGPALAGIEDMTLDHEESSARHRGMAGIVFWNTAQCWVKNVRSLTPGRNHVWLVQASRSEIRDSYFYGVASGGGSTSYGIDLYMGGDSLVVNNIFQHITSPVLAGTTSGDVIAYNFATDMPYGNPDWMQFGLNSHGLGNAMMLLEGNQTNGFVMDLFHGAGQLATAFRNRFTGRDGGGGGWASPFAPLIGRLPSVVRNYLVGRDGPTSNTTPVQIWGYNRFANLVGNVLGTPGYHTVYEASAEATKGNPWRSIYLLGHTASGEGNSACCPYDPLVRATMLRWGNYDAATRGVRWLAAEIPTREFPFVKGNPVPAHRTLPPSLFLTAAPPAWWATPWGVPPWPAVGPDVTGGEDPTGHAHKIPARLCYEHTPKDGRGVLLFTAAACYGTKSAY